MPVKNYEACVDSLKASPPPLIPVFDYLYFYLQFVDREVLIVPQNIYHDSQAKIIMSINMGRVMDCFKPPSWQGGLVVKRPPGNQKVGGSNPTTVTW